MCPTGGGMDGDVVAIERQVKVVLERIHRAAERSGRPPALVRLIAASSKTAPVERLRDAWQAGVRHFGENRLQEAPPKIEQLGRPDVTWHFIGTLQRRKVKAVVGRFHTIHSVDSLALAEEIDRRAAEADLPAGLAGNQPRRRGQ
ncbi:MAG: hypothetical protein U0231_09595 [Nitrospiraceae bacterium]